MTRETETPQVVLRIEGLRVYSGRTELLRGVDLAVHAGECVALVGDSGAGKSLLARAALGLLPDGLTSVANRHDVHGADMREAGEHEWRSVLGRTAGYVHQDALGALDPLMRVGTQTAAPLRRHQIGQPAERPGAARAALVRAGLPEAAGAAHAWPHELSGGMRQRALIAGALVAGPGLLVADEPTTALDATVQRRVLEMLRAEIDGAPWAGGTSEIRSVERGHRRIGLLLVSHDLAAVARIADRVLVLSRGEVVESGPTAELLSRPKHPTTIALLEAVRPRPRTRQNGAARTRTSAGSQPRTGRVLGAPAREATPGPCIPALEARGLAVRHPGAAQPAISGVNFALQAGRTLGVLGESGAGKSSLAAALLGTRAAAEGEVLLAGGAWSDLPERSRRPHRHRIQLIPQSAAASFSPGVRVRHVLIEAIRAATRAQRLPRCSRAEQHARVRDLLMKVGLDPALAARQAHTLSGGQAQRLAIARALATNPDVLVCDEAVSALDATVQARVLDLLASLQRETGVAIVFISHDVEAVRRVADDVLVLRAGAVVEQGGAQRVLAHPEHAFTRELLAAAAPLPASLPEPG